MDILNFKHLYYFYIVAQEGSIKEAASKVHVTQSTISDQLRLLEEFWDCKLFERKHRSLILTQSGMLALDFAKEVFDKSQKITAAFRNKTKLPKQHIDIGVSYLISQHLVYENLLPLFTKQNNIAVNIQENRRHVLLADLEKGNLDLIFTDTKSDITLNMSATKIGLSKVFALAHKNLINNGAEFPSCLNHLPFFNYSHDSNLRFEIDLYFSKHGLSPKVIGEGDDVDLIELITTKGLAFTVVTEATKNRITSRDKDIKLLGEMEGMESTIWGIVKNGDKGLGYKLLNGNL